MGVQISTCRLKRVPTPRRVRVVGTLGVRSAWNVVVTRYRIWGQDPMGHNGPPLFELVA